MKKLIAVLIMVIVSMMLMACGNGGNDSDDSGDNDVTVSGQIYNEEAVAALDVYGIRSVLAVPNIPNSILNSGCDQLSPIYMDPISQGETIAVEWTIENNTDNPLIDIQYNVEFENTEAMHRETWTCIKWYDRWAGTGSSGDAIWEESGGYFYNAIAAPTLPACESPMAPAIDICDPLTHDCLNPWWSIEHNEASGGCTHASGFVSIRAHESVSGINSYMNSNIDIRAGHLARFQALYDGRLMDEKCYIFEVTP